MLNLPNILTILRILLVPGFILIMYSDIAYANQFACTLFAVASITDFVDGYLARKYRLVTNLGKVLDPVADKIMVTAALVILVEQGKLASWIVILMLFRDFAVGALRDVAAQQGEIIAAGIWGKIKTILQMLAIGFLMFYDNLVIFPINSFSIVPYGNIIENTVYIPSYLIGHRLIIVALFASIYSGIIYFSKFRKVLMKIDK